MNESARPDRQYLFGQQISLDQFMAAEEMGGDYDTYIMPLVLTACTPGWRSTT